MTEEEVNLEILMKPKLPLVPNFITCEDGAGGEFTIPIHRLSDSQLCSIGDLWTRALLAKARRMREAQNAK